MQTQTSTLPKIEQVNLRTAAEAPAPVPKPAVFGLTGGNLPAAASSNNPAADIELEAAPMKPEEMIFSDKWINLAKAVRFSKFIPAALRSSDTYDSTYDILMYLATAASLGLKVPAALFNRSLYITPSQDGGYNVSLWTDTKKAIAAAHKLQIRSWYDEASFAGICEIVRNGTTYTGVYTVTEAVTAGKMYIDQSDGRPYGCVTKNGKDSVWRTHWTSMLMRRAESRALSQACPDLLLGFTSAEEAAEMQSIAGSGGTAMLAEAVPVEAANEHAVPHPEPISFNNTKEA